MHSTSNLTTDGHLHPTTQTASPYQQHQSPTLKVPNITPFPSMCWTRPMLALCSNPCWQDIRFKFHHHIWPRISPNPCSKFFLLIMLEVGSLHLCSNYVGCKPIQPVQCPALCQPLFTQTTDLEAAPQFVDSSHKFFLFNTPTPLVPNRQPCQSVFARAIPCFPRAKPSAKHKQNHLQRTPVSNFMQTIF